MRFSKLARFFLFSALLGLFSLSANADSLYSTSAAAVIGASTADAVSSWHRPELNPVLGSQFDARSVAIKGALAAVSLGFQHIALRHRPDLRRKFTWLNFGTSAVVGGVAVRNWRVQ